MPRYENGSVSNSQLTTLKRSVAEFYQRYILDSWPDKEESDTLKLGSLVHCMALEPEKVNERFAVAPEVDGRTKEGKAAKAAFAETIQGKTIVSSGVFDRAVTCHMALQSHHEAAAILKFSERSDAMIERPIHGEWNGVAVAGTPDLVVLELGLIVDVKTTSDASPAEFSKSVVNYGYHRQAAMYLELCQQAYGMADRFVFVVVKTAPPYEVAVYELNYPSVMQGRTELLELLDEHKRRSESGDWSADWQKGVIELPLPRWYRDQSFMFSEVES
jgi:hypothetical protein